MESKPWYKSKGVIGGIIATVCSLLVVLGVAGAEGAGEESGAIADNIVAIIAAVGGIFAIIGRITAKTKIAKPNGTVSIILILFVLTFTGCCAGGLPPRYRQTVEMSAIAVGELNKACQAGDPNACREGLDAASETLNLIVDAMYGRDSDGTD